MEQDYGQTDYEGFSILAADEISICRGHRYQTVVLDYLTGRVVWVGKDRKVRTLKRFFNGMTKKQRKAFKAIAMDMWDPYIRVIREKVPHVAIVFDLFHVVSQFNRIIDKVRNSEYQEICKAHKAIIKGTKYLLLKNRPKIRRLTDRKHLEQLLKLNKPISTVNILKEKLKHIWSYKSRTWANKATEQ